MTDALQTPPGENTTLHFQLNAVAKALMDAEADAPPGVGKADAPAPKRFNVYRNNVVVSLINAMREAFPSLLAIMGAENFDRVARIYVNEHPPRSPLMQHYGITFPQFLADFVPLRKSLFLADVARAERAWLDAYHAPDHDPLTAETIGAVAPEEAAGLVLKPHPAATLIASNYPLFDLFNARETWPKPEINLATSQPMLITRPEYACMIAVLDDGALAFFKAAFAGESLGGAIAAGLEADAGFNASAAIGLALQTGAFAALQA